jgi:hypothetical protein
MLLGGRFLRSPGWVMRPLAGDEDADMPLF